MLEAITSAGYDLELVRDLWRILFTDWSESEGRFLFLLTVVLIGPLIHEIRDRSR